MARSRRVGAEALAERTDVCVRTRWLAHGRVYRQYGRIEVLIRRRHRDALHEGAPTGPHPRHGRGASSTALRTTSAARSSARSRSSRTWNRQHAGRHPLRQRTLRVRQDAPPNIGTCVYGVSKLSIRAFAKFVAEEEREFNICVLSMGPGSGGGDERARESGAGIPGGGGGIVTEDSPQWARESPRPAQVDTVGDRYVLAAQASMDFSGHQVTVRDGALAIVED